MNRKSLIKAKGFERLGVARDRPQISFRRTWKDPRLSWLFTRPRAFRVPSSLPRMFFSVVASLELLISFKFLCFTEAKADEEEVKYLIMFDLPPDHANIVEHLYCFWNKKTFSTIYFLV